MLEVEYVGEVEEFEFELLEHKGADPAREYLQCEDGLAELQKDEFLEVELDELIFLRQGKPLGVFDEILFLTNFLCPGDFQEEVFEALIRQVYLLNSR